MSATQYDDAVRWNKQEDWKHGWNTWSKWAKMIKQTNKIEQLIDNFIYEWKFSISCEKFISVLHVAI